MSFASYNTILHPPPPPFHSSRHGTGSAGSSRLMPSICRNMPSISCVNKRDHLCAAADFEQPQIRVCAGRLSVGVSTMVCLSVWSGLIWSGLALFLSLSLSVILPPDLVCCLSGLSQDKTNKTRHKTQDKTRHTRQDTRHKTQDTTNKRRQDTQDKTQDKTRHKTMQDNQDTRQDT
jgi:hypothetical protein